MKSILCGTVISVENTCTEPMTSVSTHIHCSKALKEHWKKHQILVLGAKSHAKYLYWYGLGNVLRMKACHITLVDQLHFHQSTVLNSTTPQKSKWKDDTGGQSFLPKFNCRISKWYSEVCKACMHVWQCRRCNLAAKHNVPEVCR